MKVIVFYTGTSLLAPLKDAEREINRRYKLNVRVAAYNFGSPLDQKVWNDVTQDLSDADVVFVIHVMDGENGTRLLDALRHNQKTTVIVINCMPELMRRTRMGKLDASKLLGAKARRGDGETRGQGDAEKGGQGDAEKGGRGVRLFNVAGSWIGRQAHGRNGKTQEGKSKQRGHGQYLKLIDKLPGILKFVPGAGMLRDVKNYLYLFCYFLQPTPGNIRSMLLYALTEYVAAPQLSKIKIPPPERMPSVAIYHPDATQLFESFTEYERWYRRRPKSKHLNGKGSVAAQRNRDGGPHLQPDSTIGLLLMRPQVVSKTTKHYDALIHALEDEGLSVIPAISTLMDNREACQKFFLEAAAGNKSKAESPKSKMDQRKVQSSKFKAQTTDRRFEIGNSRVSQILSLTGFSFVGGPAMNDSDAASDFLATLNVPYRSAVSLDTQSIEAWRDSQIGLNPVQTGMQIAIPEIDGATEPFVFGGIPAIGVEPIGLEDRCRRLAKRLRRANRLRTSPRSDLKLGFVLFCFPPNKGNIGTAADLDVFPSLWHSLDQLKADGYNLDLPSSPDALRNKLLDGNSEKFGATANVAYRMSVDEYRRLCPYVDEIEEEWGRAPGRINSLGNHLLIQGITIGNVFIGVQPTFGYEGDPMRLMMARSGAPHHGFMAFYTYLSQVLDVDAVIHVGTHGSLEFMPGKQVGLSSNCWPDRLIGELPNFYIYSVNNPSEGSIAKRRSYAELISYLTPPLENAGLYREFAELKDLVISYRRSTNEQERESLFEIIEESSSRLNLIHSDQ
ncbi:MAG TPA: cobaltochelatase subunit CobN [Pyrinomonadaceae bacterium]|nr:cobaltochelatase subunit CobN [Pyrinomonadaceae bacterium]